MSSLIKDYQKVSKIGMKAFLKNIHGPFQFYNIPYFQIPTISSAQLTTSCVSFSEIKTLENYVLKNTRNHSLHIKFLYSKETQKESVSKVLTRNGYLETDRFVVNYWFKPIEFSIPSGYSFRFGDYFDKSLYADFDMIMKNVFKVDDKFQKNVTRLTRDMRVSPKIVVIYDKKGMPVATGGVTVIGDTGWLFSGSIKKSHQGRGLWYTLLSTRQILSQELGAKKWLLETQNKKILTNYQKQFKQCYFTKILKE